MRSVSPIPLGRTALTCQGQGDIMGFMKVKEIKGRRRKKCLKVGIRSAKELLEEFKEAARAIDEGNFPRRSEGLYFESLESLHRCLTDQRLELVRTIREKEEVRTEELVAGHGRPQAEVEEDLKALKDIGLVSLKGGVWQTTCDLIRLEISL